jgi:uncharacterized membrane protein
MSDYATRLGGKRGEQLHRKFLLAVCASLIGYWISIGSAHLGYSVPYVRAITGMVLLGVLPGALAYRLLSRTSEPIGLFLLYSVGLSLAIVSILTVLLSELSPLLGVVDPLSTIPFAATVTTLVVLFVLSSLLRDGAPFSYPHLDRTSIKVAVLLLSLPLLSVLAAWLVRDYGVNVLMYIVIFGVVALVFAAPRWLPTELYPLAVFAIATTALLHRNLVSEFLIGHDVQLNYYLSSQIMALGQWDPALGGSLISLPVVTAVPVAYASVAGIGLALVMKGVYSVIFALVPVGMFYLFDRVFDRNAAFFGCSLFIVYHAFFESTPDKQPIAELFAVLVLITLLYRLTRSATDYLLLVLLSVGLIQTHYGLTYVFVIVLFGASVLVYGTRLLTGTALNNRLPLSYAVLLFIAATEWYFLTSPELTFRIQGLPFTIFDQLSLLLSLTVPLSDTGASYTNQAREPLYSLIVYLYLCMTALVGLGLLRRALSVVRAHRIDRPSADTELVALAGVFFALLGSSYFVSGNLGADRLYQIALLVVGPFAAVGYVTLRSVFSRVVSSARRIGWVPLSCLVIAIWLVNAGVVYQAAGLPPTAVTLDEDTHDFVFSQAEVEGAQWIEANAGIERRNGTLTRVVRQERLGVIRALRTTNDTRVYTDEYSLAMFRAVVPPTYYRIEILNLKDDEYGIANATGGYIYLRDRAIIDVNRGQTLPRQNVSHEEARYISNRDSLVYSNNDARVFLARNNSNVTSMLGNVSVRSAPDRTGGGNDRPAGPAAIVAARATGCGVPVSGPFS